VEILSGEGSRRRPGASEKMTEGGSAARKRGRLVVIPVLVSVLLSMALSPAWAQEPEDELGNWLIYNGTIRVADRWSVFTETQLRLWEPFSNLNEWFVRGAGHYHLSPRAAVGLGYGYFRTWPYDEGPVRTENRIYQQFTIWHDWSRSRFEHRYRLEQRWLEEAGETDYSNRFRYRLQVTAPLNLETMEPGAHFINSYNEIFLNFDSERAFDQNRLYAAWGRQFTKSANLQLGLLWQARTSEDFFKLQIFYTHNFDLRDRE
jgi:hypothetical protein